MKLTKMALAACLIAAPVFLPGCKKLLQADVNFTSQDVNFDINPVSDTAVVTTIGSATVTENIDSLIKAETKGALGIANIKHAYITNCEITIQNADQNNNFANFQSCSASFTSNTNSTPVQLGSVTNNSVNYSSDLTLPIDNSIDYAPYLNATTFYYTATGKLRTPITTTLHCTAKVKFKIHVSA
jgi:hypothetical protein